MPTTVAAVRQDVQEWLDREGLKVSQYGTVRMVKVVESDGQSKQAGSAGRLAYEPGTTVVCPDYNEVPECGHGLHFAATARKAQDIISCRNPRYLVCDVDVETMVLIEGNKVKARFCHVRFAGDETDFGRFV